MGRNLPLIQRRRILELQNYTCPGNDLGTFGCGKTINIRTAEFHHQRAWRDGGDNDDGNLVALCKSCHQDITNQGNSKHW